MPEPIVPSSSVALNSLYFAVFLDMFGGLMVMPLMQFVALDMHASPFQLGILSSMFAFAQVLGSLGMGFLSDKVGRRIVLLVCLATTGVSLILFGLAQSFMQLLVFRIMDGFFSGTLGIAQAMIADLVLPEERAGAMAKCGSMLGLGLILGPGVGGLLAPLGFPGVCFVAAGVTFFNFFIALLSLPKVQTAGARKGTDDSVGADIEASEETLISVLGNSRIILYLYMCNFLFMTGMGIFIGINSLFLRDFYGIGARQIGFVIMIAGFTMAFLQALVTKRVVARAGEKFAILLGIASRLASFVFNAYVFNPCVPWILPIIVISGSAFFIPCVATMVTNHSPEQKRGALLGIHQSMSSAGTFVGPLLGGALYTVEATLAYKVGAILNLVTLGIALYFLPVDAPETFVEKDASLENDASLEKDHSLENALLKAKPKAKLTRRASKLELVHDGSSFSFPMATSNSDTGGYIWSVTSRHGLKRKSQRRFTMLEAVAEMPEDAIARRKSSFV